MNDPIFPLENFIVNDDSINLQPKQVFFVFALIIPSSQISADCYYAAVHLAVQYAIVHSCKKVFFVHQLV